MSTPATADMTSQSVAQSQTHKVPPEGSPCWVEIMSADPPKLKTFYESLFTSWSFKDHGGADAHGNDVMHYEFAKPAGLSGGIVKLPEGLAPGDQPLGRGMTMYYFVGSIEETAMRIKELGGLEVLPKTQLPRDMGWFANYHDPEGNRFGIFEVSRDAKNE